MARILQDMSLEEQDDYFNDIEIKDIIKKSIKTYNRVEIKQDEPKFKCRLCGHIEYEGVYVSSGFDTIGGTRYPTSYQCKCCSVIFKDFVKFSVKE